MITHMDVDRGKDEGGMLIDYSLMFKSAFQNQTLLLSSTHLIFFQSILYIQSIFIFLKLK